MMQVSLFMIRNLQFPATEVKLSSLRCLTLDFVVLLVPTVLLLEKKQVKNPAPFLIQQVLAPTAAEGSEKKRVGQTPQTTPIP